MTPSHPYPRTRAASPKTKTEFLFGIHPVTEAIAAGRRLISEVFVSQKDLPDRTQKILNHVNTDEIPIRFVNASYIRSLTETDAHQGIAASVSHLPVVELSLVLDRIQTDADISPLFLILDGILDPHNLGALLRTALCVGVDGVIIPKDRSARPTPVVSKVSAGALEHSRLVTVTNLVRTIRDMKQAGVWIYGLESVAKTSVFNVDLTEPVGIVIGGEAKGVRRLVRVNCDEMVSIPQIGAINSLNASVAGAVAMYEVFRQRCS